MRLLSVLSGTFALVAPLVQAQPPSRPPWAINQTSTVPVSVGEDIRRAVASLEHEKTETIKGVVADLNDDGFPEFVLQSAARLCGNGGCVYLLLDGVNRRKVGEFFGSSLIVRAERSHGYPNIATYSPQNADAADYKEYSFDGTTYVVRSARRVEGAARSRLLEELRLVPIWRPRR